MQLIRYALQSNKNHRMRKHLLSLLLIAAPAFIYAQTFTGTGGAIPNNSMPGYFSIATSGLPSAMSASFGVQQVCINISHTHVADLAIHLEAPDYTAVELSSGNGGGGADYTNTCFDNSAPVSITSGTTPFSGSFRPEGYFGRFHEGTINPNGAWRLRVIDVYSGQDVGSVISWSITFGANVAPPVSFSSSNLPIIRLSTTQGIPDEPKVTATMGIVYNGPNVRNNLTDVANNYNGKVMIEVRGSSSQQFDKKSYTFQTVNSVGADLDVPLLGMPADHEWVLHAPYSDKSLMRNYLTYSLANSMGRWAPRCRYVELVIDGRYQGVYVLMESISRSNDRVDIAKLTTTDNIGDAVSGGYIIKIDRRNGSNQDGWWSNIASTSPSDTVFYQYHYPEGDRITTQQKAYIQQFMRNFETAMMSPSYADPLNGYRKYIDVESFVDFFIINEISKNVDGYRLSSYMYKDKDSKGGKLHMGPVWDYDIAWSNADYGMGNDPSGWQYTAYDIQFPMPQWWGRLVQDPYFMNMVKCRWLQLRLYATDPTIMGNFIDQTAATLNESQARNFTIWPTIGTVVWPNPSPVPASYQGEVDALKSWVSNRVTWIDYNIQGSCQQIPLSIEDISDANELTVYPNPFTGIATLKYSVKESSDVRIDLYDMMGREVRTLINERKDKGAYELTIDGRTLSPGMYFYRLNAGENVRTCRVIIQKQ
jgi:subtilisin-like proprotein convertase family protein